MRQADTDVRQQNSDETRHDTSTRSGRGSSPPRLRAGRSPDWIGELLGEWQRTELRIARGLAECRGLGTEQLEDLYQETALALLSRPYGSEEHLRNALRHGIKHRTLNLHRDTRRRSQILAQSAPSMQRIAESRESHAGPEEAALVDQDRLIVKEFLTELDEVEQRVFWLIADGMRYRAIAPILRIPSTRRATPPARVSESANASNCSTIPASYADTAPRQSKHSKAANSQARSSPGGRSHTSTPARAAAPSTGRTRNGSAVTSRTSSRRCCRYQRCSAVWHGCAAHGREPGRTSGAAHANAPRPSSAPAERARRSPRASRPSP
jgi:RNA polymerase sigma factor (sigma-70 family)